MARVIAWTTFPLASVLAPACNKAGPQGTTVAARPDSSAAGARSGTALAAPPGDPEATPPEGLELIDRSDLRKHLGVLAADSLEGRRAGTRGADRAAAYLAEQLKALGLVPLGPDFSYLQRFRIPSYGPRGPGASDSTQNVVGLVPGEDPASRGQYVALGAHYDHLGIGPPLAGDSIYNGADDDGSGTAAVLEVAEALARGPRPRRSVLVVFHGGEEEGLLGSFHFTLRPPVPRDSIVAQLNVDMVGRNSPDSLAIIGAGRISSDLDRIVRRHAEAEGLALDYTFDAPDHPERLYFRSDHYNYAQYGIPIAFFFAGLHPDYHQPSDEVEKIDFGKVENAAELIYRVAWEVANRRDRLPRDRLDSPTAR